MKYLYLNFDLDKRSFKRLKAGALVGPGTVQHAGDGYIYTSTFVDYDECTINKYLEWRRTMPFSKLTFAEVSLLKYLNKDINHLERLADELSGFEFGGIKLEAAYTDEGKNGFLFALAARPLAINKNQILICDVVIDIVTKIVEGLYELDEK